MNEITNIKPFRRPENQPVVRPGPNLQATKKKRSTKPSKRASIPIFQKHGRVSVVGKTKGWLPYALNRLRHRAKTSAIIEPSVLDLEILSKIGFDETMLRLSRLRVALGRTNFAKTDEGMAAIQRIELHVSAMYIAAQQIAASDK